MIATVFVVIAGMMLVTGIIMELYSVLKAPLGYQDQTGFHVAAKAGDEEDGSPWTNPS
ncbi:MAG: hypothetical protein JWR19_464 [Pedosphaera sp.]|nr:hypothetical protein [Pedosphaera sp.]